MIENEHWLKPPDRETTLAGKLYSSYDGIYRLVSHHDCGFHLERVRAKGKEDNDLHKDGRACVSERAIGNSFFEMREETPYWIKTWSEFSEGARTAMREAEGFPNARFYRNQGTYFVDKGQP